MASGRKNEGRARFANVWRIVVIGALILTLPVVAVILVLFRGGGDEEDGPPKAAIVDQLSLTVPNPEFARDATATLEQAGYVVDYYPGEEVTVSFYRQLPFLEYDVIVFRSHADRLKAIDDRGEAFDEVVLFTSEPYTEDRYQSEQNDHDLMIVRYSEGGDPFFGVAAGFIDNVENGFDGAQIIMMGCEGLLTDTTAKAFIDRGAESYISWNETVTAAHTDAATTVLLGHLLLDGLPPGAAVAETMTELGPDPLFGSELLAYPPET
jgi:hypothetical protein